MILDEIHAVAASQARHPPDHRRRAPGAAVGRVPTRRPVGHHPADADDRRLRRRLRAASRPRARSFLPQAPGLVSCALRPSQEVRHPGALSPPTLRGPRWRSRTGTGPAPRKTRLWQLLVERHSVAVIRRNRSTLLFANSRRMTEKDDAAGQRRGELNETSPILTTGRWRARCARWSRSGSRRGELKAIVATSSLELGIDVGALDEVVLIQTPRAISPRPSSASAAPDTGSARSAAGCSIPTHGRDFLDAAVVARSDPRPGHRERAADRRRRSTCWRR